MSGTPTDKASSSHHAWRRALTLTAPIAQNTSVTLPTVIQDLGDKFGASPALLSDRACLSYRELAQRVNRYARWALGQGLTAGDVVCLIMPNCPEYLAIWLGLTRVGAVVSLVNTNLAGDALVHSIAIAAPRHLIVGADLLDGFDAVLPRLRPGIQCWAHGPNGGGLPRVDQEVDRSAAHRLDASEHHPPSIWDTALYIYTSGTTGFPKAARVSHFRLMQWAYWFAGMMDTRPTDRMYNCLPMYHGIGGVVATGATLVNGGSVVLRERFSANQFWDDVSRWECTLFQYIGELCRYLLHGGAHAREAQHRIRLCCGNGLRADVWETFQHRFRIPEILEFYASTEGAVSFYNCEGKPGSIGRIPGFLAHRDAVTLIKLDLASGEPLRDENGSCLHCSVGEVGEAVGRIAGGVPSGRFEGYTDKEASDRKVLHDAFVKGDAWFRTGDVMRRDRSGFFYFVDRIGDTFRWKGENVSTTQVEEAIAACTGIIEAVVYGVNIPRTEGRAGMAAVVTAEDFDLEEFRDQLTERLPEYARPVFIRMAGDLERTGTLRPLKQRLADEGYDPSAIADRLYVNDRAAKVFVKLDAALYQRILGGTLRL